jgi:hypothetical protein
VKEYKPYIQLIPEKILEILPDIASYFQHIHGYSLDNLKEIISIVAYHIRKDNEDGTPLKMVYMRELVPQAGDYLKIFIELQIFERTGNAIKGVSSYKYRFTEQYQSKFCFIPLTNAKLLNRIRKHRTSMRKRNSKMYPHQNKFIRNMTIEPEALEFAKEIYTNKINELYESVSTVALDAKQQKDYQEKITKIEKRYNYSVASISKIMFEPPYMTVDKTSGRYHSNLTSLPKELRQFVRIYGKRLSNVDVKNCHPYLSTLLLTNPGKVAEFTKNPNFSMLLTTLQVSQTEDVKRYVSLVVKGELYEYLISEFESRGYKFKGVNFDEKREEVKKKLLQILYDKNIRNPNCRRIFAELFPEVHKVFSIVRGDEKSRDKFHNYKRFAILLQRIESYLILNKVLGKINKEHPDVIAVTVHDSIMTDTDTDHIEIVQQIMWNELEKFVGFAPKLKVE